MQYRIHPKTGDRISVLGYGCLRFSKNALGIDQKKAEQELTLAYDSGVNYYDTGYIYPGSEEALGKWLSRGYRDKVFVATKTPQYLLRDLKAFDGCLAQQLRRLRTDHIDYYLFHMLNDDRQWARLRALGIEEWIARQKAAGKIRHVGFSFHGGTEQFIKVLDAYDWDTCYVQYNYMDETSQAGVRGVRYAAEKGIGVVIMEPLRGGRLCHKLPKGALAAFAAATEQRSPAAWGLQWLWDQEEVLCVLSGMNDREQVRENAAAADRAAVGALTARDREMFSAVRAAVHRATKVGCTGCGYCMPCPHGVDIPVCFRTYNDRWTDGWYTGMKEYLMCTTLKRERSNASLCVGCGKCEQHCPQSIPIRRELKEVRRSMETPVYKAAAAVLGLVFKG